MLTSVGAGLRVEPAPPRVRPVATDPGRGSRHSPTFSRRRAGPAPVRRHVDRRGARLRSLRLGAPVLDPRQAARQEEAALVVARNVFGWWKELTVAFAPAGCRGRRPGGAPARRDERRRAHSGRRGRRVRWSGINYKDALAITRPGEDPEALPLNAGIDAPGSWSRRWNARFRGPTPSWSRHGPRRSRDGGFAEVLRRAGDRVVPLPAGLTLPSRVISHPAQRRARRRRMELNGQQPTRGRSS